jgi:hypothetical protein
LSLKTYPERYKFATHEGFAFVEGTFGEAGARFFTRETFLGLKLRLDFELMAVDALTPAAVNGATNGAVRCASFRFKLLRPLGGRIWGTFLIDGVAPQAAILYLKVGASDRLGRVFLHFLPLAAVVRAQIRREVAHIKASMETVFGRT